MAKKSAKANGSANGVLSGQRNEEKTDYTRWRLRDDHGKQTWHYLQTDEQMKAWPQTTADKYFLGLPTVCRLEPVFTESAL